MQEGIYQIGCAVALDSSEEDRIVQKIPTEKKGKVQHILKINFNTKDETLSIDGNEEVKKDSHKKYLFVDKVGGPNSPQWLVTRNSLQYHVSETINSLTDLDFGQEINENIKQVLQKFFIDLGEEIDKKYRYILDFKKFNIVEEDLKEEFNKILEEENTEDKKEIKKLAKTFTNKYVKIFENYIKEKTSLKPNEIAIYTIFINDKALAQTKEYREVVVDKKLGGKPKKKGKTNELVCSMCNSTSSDIGDTKKLSLKFYTTNQVIFSSDLTGDYTKNMVLCEECLNNIMAGENYIKDNLNTNIAGLSVYLIPHFIFGQPLDKNSLDNTTKWIKNSFNTVKNIKSIEKFKEHATSEKKLEDEIEDKNSYFLLNILFYKRVNQATKIKRLIKDINPSIFDEIYKSQSKARQVYEKAIDKSLKTFLGLESIYYLTPIRIKDGEMQQYNNLLYMYDAIFTKRTLDKKVIIKSILDAIVIKYLKKEGYNIKAGENNEIRDMVIQSGMYLKFLEYLGCIKGSEKMDVTKLIVKDDIKNYIDNMSYNEEETAMFLLGYLMGEIGNCEYKRAKEGKKPILNKLNYSGIDKNKIIRLSNLVFNKLRQEKILTYNEIIYNQCKQLIDENLNHWKMDKSENLYYILSGYSYSSTKAILNSKKENNEEKENEGGNVNEQ